MNLCCYHTYGLSKLRIYVNIFTRNLRTDIKGEIIFHLIKKCCGEKEIPLKYIISFATDGASTMTRRHKEFIVYLKIKVPDLLSVHYVINSQHLIAKNFSNRLHTSL